MSGEADKVTNIGQAVAVQPPPLDMDMDWDDLPDAFDKPRNRALANRLWSTARELVLTQIRSHSIFGVLQQEAERKNAERSLAARPLVNGVNVAVRVRMPVSVVQVLAHRKVQLKFYKNGKMTTDSYQKYLEQFEVNGGATVAGGSGGSAATGTGTARVADVDDGFGSSMMLDSLLLDKSGAGVTFAKRTSGVETSTSITLPPTPDSRFQLDQTADLNYVVCLTKTQELLAVDLSRGYIPNEPQTRTRLPAEANQIQFIDRLGVYVTCFQDQSIKFLDPRFEYLNTYSLPFPIVFLRYNAACNVLVVVGAKDVLMLSLEGAVRKGRLRISARPLGDHAHICPSFDEPNGWVKEVYVQERARRLHIVMDNSILVYNMRDGELVHKVRFQTRDSVTAVFFSDMFQWLIVGFANGSIKILTTAFMVFHEFSGNGHGIVQLLPFSQGRILVSVGQDDQVVLWNLKSLEEIYRYEMEDSTAKMGFLADRQIYLWNKESLTLASLNYTGQAFASFNTPLRFLKHYKIPKLGVPSRLLVGTADGTIRLLSPISGNTLTIAFPVVDSEQIKSAVYSVRTNKIFLLLHNLEIWVIATNVNPCMVIDIWKRSDDDGDDECTILDLLECNDYEKWPHIAQSNFPLRRRRNTRQRKASTIAAPPSSLMHGGELLPKSTATPRRCTFLIGGTPAGHLIVYGKDSKVVHRMLIHHGEVSSISINSDLGLIATGSVDDQTVRLTQFNPTAQQMFAPLHLLAKNIMPMMLNCSNVFTAIGNNDGTVMIVRTADGHVIRAHPKVDDHNGAITSLVFLPKQEVFVSSSADGLIKVWQCEENILLRELQFAEPVLGLTRANGRGDVLVAFGSRVEFISAHALLPSALARFAIKDESSAKEPEQPLPIETAAGVNLYKWRKIKAGDVSAKVDELFEEVLKFGPQHKSPSTTDDNTHAVEKEAYEEQRQLLEELDIGGLVVPIRVPSVKKLDEVVPISVINDGIDDVNESAKAPIKLLQSFVDRINERHKQMIRFHEAAIEEEKNARLGKAEDKCDEAIPTVQANEVTAPVVKSVLEADLEAMPVKKLADLFQSLLDGEKTDLSKLQQVLDEKKMAEARRKAQERRMASDAKQKQKYAVNRQQQEIVILRRLRRAGANTRGSVKQQAQVLVTRRNEPLPRTVSSNNASSGVTIREEELRLEAIRQTVLENERKIAIISSNYKARLAAFVQESEEQETAASDALNVVDESAHSNDKPMNAAQAIMSGRPPPRPLTPNYFRKPRPPLIEELLREPWIQEQDLYDMELSWEGKWRHRSAVRRLLCAASGDGVAPILLRLCKEAAEDLPKRSLIVKYIARMAYDNLFEKSPPIVAKQLCWFLTEQYDLTQLKAPEIELRVTLINALLLLGVETKEVMTSIALQTASLDERLRSCAMEALQILGFYENGAKAIAKHSNKIVADVLEKDFMGLPMSTPPQDYFAERVSDVLDSQERSQTSTLQSERVQVASRPASERRILRHQERLDEFARASAETMESRTLPTTPWVDEQTEETEKVSITVVPVEEFTDVEFAAEEIPDTDLQRSTTLSTSTESIPIVVIKPTPEPEVRIPLWQRASPPKSATLIPRDDVSKPKRKLKVSPNKKIRAPSFSTLRSGAHTGQTHQSRCHESIETMDVTFAHDRNTPGTLSHHNDLLAQQYAFGRLSRGGRVQTAPKVVELRTSQFDLVETNSASARTFDTSMFGDVDDCSERDEDDDLFDLGPTMTSNAAPGHPQTPRQTGHPQTPHAHPQTPRRISTAVTPRPRRTPSATATDSDPLTSDKLYLRRTLHPFEVLRQELQADGTAASETEGGEGEEEDLSGYMLGVFHSEVPVEPRATVVTQKRYFVASLSVCEQDE